MTRAAIYIRVSTEEQAEEGYSLEAQQERLVAYCEAQGWDIADIFADRGHTGRNIRNRDEYKRMMAEKDKWDNILVLKMDRIHRNSKNFMIMMENLEKWDKKFTSMQEELDTSTSIGRFVVDMIQRIAQLESEQIGERTYMGMAQKAETGGLLGFNPPYGYGIENNDLVVKEDEAAMVRGMFGSYLSGMSMNDIAQSLNGRGIFTRRGAHWTLYSVRQILHNPAYAGYRRWDGFLVKSGHSSIIDLDTYNAVQEMAASKTRDPRKRGRKVLAPVNS
ncbi:MAG: recombinase family protein [Methanomassiliicoccales archaeon]|nr:recombinase family protein [Methanomassiliicoccales archaeon]